jgi:hypothetical protein
MWTPLYFGLGKPIPATIDIFALGGTLACLINIWGQVDSTCGWLLAPYLCWVSFATYLCVRSALFDWLGAWLANIPIGRIWLLEQLGLYVYHEEGVDK